jgi:CBS-domain-containing membrane protein
LSAPTWSFMLTPTLIGAIVLVLVALFFNNIPKQRTYPRYWL